jgi:uncharacterized membrane protein
MEELLADLHPPLVAFPLVLTWTVLIIELINLKLKSAEYSKLCLGLLVVAAALTFAAYQTGHQAGQLASRSFVVPEAEIGHHFLWAKIFLFTLIGALILKATYYFAKFNVQFWRVLYLIVLIVSAGLVTNVGRLGGDLVFEHGAGVSLPGISSKQN